MTKYNITGKRESSNRSIINKWPVLLFAVLVFGFLSKAAWNAYLEKRQSDRAVETAKLELQKLEERNIFIKDELEKLSTENGREAKLREKFGVGRPGEQVAIIVKAENDDESLEDDQNIWQKIKVFFKSLIQR